MGGRVLPASVSLSSWLEQRRRATGVVYAQAIASVSGRSAHTHPPSPASLGASNHPYPPASRHRGASCPSGDCPVGSRAIAGSRGGWGTGPQPRTLTPGVLFASPP